MSRDAWKFLRYNGTEYMNDKILNLRRKIEFYINQLYLTRAEQNGVTERVNFAEISRCMLVNAGLDTHFGL